MRKFVTLFGCLGLALSLLAQSPQTYTSSEILLRLKKLKVYGAVLYMAAHPDDENTRLLAYMANEKLYRTGYLSLTRGDGGQNLIGNEQGIDLGLIRTNELLAARKVDGAEQFFSRAYDFGFSKSTTEALEKWNRELILSDAVWVIRNFRPDVIITRFPPDSRAGHGHHSASAVLAHEAFKAAADPKRFPEQLKNGVEPWQAKRILWNTFNFGSMNTQSEDQFKMDVGGYNTLLGKSYGEIAAESRSQHKSQGFGVASQRGAAYEYFVLTDGSAPEKDLMDGVETSASRLGNSTTVNQVDALINELIGDFKPENPARSVRSLVALYKLLQSSTSLDGYWRTQKMIEVHRLIEMCSGIYYEATTNVPWVAAGDSLQIEVSIINRSDVNIRSASVNLVRGNIPSPLPANEIVQLRTKIGVPSDHKPSQPYWLEKGLDGGHFNVTDQQLIGRPLSDPAYQLVLKVEIEGQAFSFTKPVQYKYTDPVNGEIFQPLAITPALTVTASPKYVFKGLNKEKPASLKVGITSLTELNNRKASFYQYEEGPQGQTVVYKVKADEMISLAKNKGQFYSLNTAGVLAQTKQKELKFRVDLQTTNAQPQVQPYAMRRIEYAHIPAITYFYHDKVKVIEAPVVTVGKKIGYIPGAGDLIPEALADLHYEVTILTEKDIMSGNLSQYDAIVTGVRAYNIHDWLNNAYDMLMKYVQDGGNMIVQYNTSNFIGPVKSKIGPYPFNISRARVTDEYAKVKFVDPQSPLLNWPNKISEADFNDWVQERGIYFAEMPAENYKAVLGMNDAGEPEQPGSLIVADYGKGRFVYTGLVFFRQLPAGVGGAYRLFANLLANPKYQQANGKSGTR